MDLYDQFMIGRPVLLAPGNGVTEIGRATGRTEGTVNAAIVPAWEDREIKIGIVGSETNSPFANPGDSGSLCQCIVRDAQDDGWNAAGLVVGLNYRFQMALVTPCG